MYTAVFSKLPTGVPSVPLPKPPALLCFKFRIGGTELLSKRNVPILILLIDPVTSISGLRYCRLAA